MKIIIFFLFLLLAVPSWAVESGKEQPDPREFFKAGIEELLQMEVTTASRKKETLEKAPAVMSVITAEEIKRFGANNLLEILDRSPSVYTLGSYMYVDNVVSMRGDRITHMDNHVLILINGRPARENIFGGLNNSIYKTFPVSQISRIEIVRGPGSVLYGTNAYAGVINVITREYEKSEGEASVEYGSFDAKKVEVSGAGKLKDLELSAGLNYFKNNGWPFRAVDETGVAGSTSFDEDNLGMTLLGDYEGIRLTGFYGNSTHQHWGSRPVWPAQAIDNHRGFADLEYERRIFDKWTAKLNLTYNYFWKEQNIGGTPETVSSTGILLEETNFFALADRVDLLLGGLVEGQSGSGKWKGRPDDIPAYDNMLLSGYFQFSYRPLDDLSLIAGGQLNKLSDQALAFVPRFGLTYQITSRIGAKLLYGEAYRSPTEGEMSINVPNVLRGNKDLKPEGIDTLDGQLFYSSEDVKASATYFNSLQKDLISRIAVPGAAQPTYGNQGSIRSQGIELEGSWKVSRQLGLQGSYTHQTNRHNSGVDDWTLMPNHMAKAGVLYSIWPELNIGLFNSFFSKPSSVAAANPRAALVNPEPDSYNYLTSNVIYDLSRTMGVYPSLRFYAVNLLDEEIYYPEFNRRAINSIPGRPGRAFYGEIAVKFK